MENFKLKISNYRNISPDYPLELEIKDDILFILGINNVGKSNILRLFYELRTIFDLVSNKQNWFHFKNEEIRVTLNNIFFDNICNQNSGVSYIRLEFISEEIECIIDLKNANTSSKHSNVLDYKPVVRTKNEYDTNFKPIDIIDYFKKSLYIGQYRTPVIKAEGDYYDISIGKKFIIEWDNWANGPDVEKRKKMRKLQYELQEIFKFNKFQITVSSQNDTLLVQTDDGSFRLDELGNGFGHFIIVLANAMIKEPSVILIDEPETGLHPRLQEAFVRALAAKSSYGVIASSHSIGLARSCADRIMSLTKEPKGKLLLSPYGKHYKATIAQSLHELGYSQFVELGGNNILLVEGRTDIKTFREILRKYGIEHNIIILSLGGSEFILSDETKIAEELGEIKRLNAKSVFVIYDSERESEKAPLNGKYEAFKKTCENLGFVVFPTEYYATESYMTEKAIKKVVDTDCPTSNRYGKVRDNWDKNKNWLIFREMDQKDFDNTKLGQFIQEKLVPIVKDS